MIGRALRKALSVFCVLTVACVVPIGAAVANEPCDYFYEQAPAQLEWFEGKEPRGVRLAIRDSRWDWGHSLHGLSVWCENCSQIAIGRIYADIGPPLSWRVNDWPPPDFAGLSTVELALHPELVSGWFQQKTVVATRPKFVVITGIETTTFGGLSGHARVLSTEYNGERFSVIVFYAEERCFSVHALFLTMASRDLALSDLAGPNNAMSFERYIATVTPEKIRPPSVNLPPPPEPLLLGDARKKAQEGKP